VSYQRKQLGQVHLTGAGVNLLYSPPANSVGRITDIYMVNNSATDTPEINFYHDDNGTTYNTTTILYKEGAMPVRSTSYLSAKNITIGPNGNLVIETPTGTPDVTITIYGEEYSALTFES